MIADADEVNVILNDGTKLKAEILGRDQKTDLALLRVKSDKPLKAGRSAMTSYGWANGSIAIGNPFSLGRNGDGRYRLRSQPRYQLGSL